MIRREQIAEIGRFQKPHGLKGEITALIHPDVNLDELRCLICEIDGIFVPFFIESWRRRGTEAILLKIDGLDSAEKISMLQGLDMYALADDVPSHSEDSADDGYFLEDLIGYHVTDNSGNHIGEVVDYDDSTANVVFMIDDENGKRIFIPATPEFIVDVNPEKHDIIMELPDGLLEMN